MFWSEKVCGRARDKIHSEWFHNDVISCYICEKYILPFGIWYRLWTPSSQLQLLLRKNVLKNYVPQTLLLWQFLDLLHQFSSAEAVLRQVSQLRKLLKSTISELCHLNWFITAILKQSIIWWPESSKLTKNEEKARDGRKRPKMWLEDVTYCLSATSDIFHIFFNSVIYIYIYKKKFQSMRLAWHILGELFHKYFSCLWSINAKPCNCFLETFL